MLLYAQKTDLSALNQQVKENREEYDTNIATCVRVENFEEKEKQLRTFTSNEITKLEYKYATIHSLAKLQKDMDKKINGLDDTQTYLEKQSGNLQQRLNKFENQMKDKLEPRDLEPIRAEIQTLATREALDQYLKSTSDRIQSFVSFIDGFRDDIEKQNQILLRYDEVLADKASKQAWMLHKTEIAFKHKEMKDVADSILKKAEGIHGSNIKILELKDEILEEVESMLQSLTEKFRKEKIAASLDPAEIPNLLKTVRMKIGHDVFEKEISKKADLKYVQSVQGTMGQLIKTEKFFLLMINEVLKLIQQKPGDEGLQVKNKKIALLLD